MADYVEEILQEMVPELDDLRRKRIFNDDELRQIVKRRREFEYSLQKTPIRPQDYLEGVTYEIALESLRRRRSKNLHWRRKTMSDFAGIRRLHLIFDRATSRFKGDLKLWYQYVDFCLRSGSTKLLSRVLLRAVKFHPRDVHLWLLAADRELKYGNIKAARSLLLRGLRCMPRSEKLWGEFLRLEVQVACHLLAVRRNAETSSAMASDGSGLVGEASAGVAEAPSAASPSVAGGDPWAPARLLLRRALERLTESPHPCALFLATAVCCLEQVDSVLPTKEGFRQLGGEVRAAIAERRPGVVEGPQWVDVSTDTALSLWEMWWKQERSFGSDWLAIASEVSSRAPLSVIQRFAVLLSEAAGSTAEEEPTRALLTLSEASRTASTDETALAVLAALDTLEPNVEAGLVAKASDKLLKQALVANPSSALLRMLALPQQSTSKSGRAEIIRKARCLTPHDAARLLLLAAETDGSQVDLLSSLLRALAPDVGVRPLLDTFLAQGLSRGTGEFRVACDNCAAVAVRLWDSPKLRATVLTTVLRLELRVYTPAQESARRLVARFEEVLTVLDDSDEEKVEWWLLYVEFAHRATAWDCGRGLPNAMDLHWRAMRSVADQSLYSEKAHRLLASGLS